MGMQDRDYYWEKQKAAAKSGNTDFSGLLNHKPNRYRKKPKKSTGSLRPLLTPALMLIGLWFAADRLLTFKASQQPAAISTPNGHAEPDTMPISGGIEITADRQGHFRGTVLINDQPMPFLIDTGATITSIPAHLASAAGLPVGAQLHSNTAGGEVVDRLTQIDSLKIGNAEIRRLDAAINQHVQEVLIGMNTLKYFDITQRGNTLTMVANGSSPQQIVRAPVFMQPNAIAAEQAPINQEIKRPTAIKKTVSCDANKVCTTRYSDR